MEGQNPNTRRETTFPSPPIPPTPEGDFYPPGPNPRPQVPGLAVVSLVLGCLSLLFLVLTAIPAIITGHVALNRIRRSNGALGGNGIAIGGLVIGYLCTFLALPLLAAILIPTVGQVRESARRTVDAANLRQITIAALIHAEDQEGRLPPTRIESDTGERDTTIHDVAFLLASRAGLNDGLIWISTADRARDPDASMPAVVAVRGESGTDHMDGKFAATRILAFDFVTGLRNDMPSSTPIGWTRGLREDGTWGTEGVYGPDGGHVAFLGGYVLFFRYLNEENTPFQRPDGTPTLNVLEALPEGARVVGAGPGSLDGQMAP